MSNIDTSPVALLALADCARMHREFETEAALRAVAAEKEKQQCEVPTGWRLVPEEPDEAMRIVAYTSWMRATQTALDANPGPQIDGPHSNLAAAYRAMLAAAPQPPADTQFDLPAHLARQRDFSASTFGPGARVQGVTDHIAKELVEVRDSDGALAEWVDVIILGFDGALRSGAEPAQIIEAMVAKQTRNEGRTWPDWRTADPNRAIEHDRSGEAIDTPTPGGPAA